MSNWVWSFLCGKILKYKLNFFSKHTAIQVMFLLELVLVINGLKILCIRAKLSNLLAWNCSECFISILLISVMVIIIVFLTPDVIKLCNLFFPLKMWLNFYEFYCSLWGTSFWVHLFFSNKKFIYFFLYLYYLVSSFFGFNFMFFS